jgi:hypothetical protein
MVAGMKRQLAEAEPAEPLVTEEREPWRAKGASERDEGRALAAVVSIDVKALESERGCSLFV